MSTSIEKTKKNDSFTSNWAFILACVGSAVGMGNIWLFPYRLAEFGGAAFLIPYIICVALLLSTALVGEMALGRFAGSGSLGAFKRIMQIRGWPIPIAEFFGWFAVLGVLVIGIGYTVVIAWVLSFMVHSFTGSAFTVADSAVYFQQVTGTNIMFWIVLSLVIAGVAIFAGIEHGIEKVNKYLMPVFVLLFVVLAVRLAFLPNAIEGYKYIFVFKGEFLFDARTWMMALSQAFYSLSLFGTVMVVYGSYAVKSDNLLLSARNVAIFDTSVSLLASFVIIPAVFAFGKSLESGPALLFITMVDIFKVLPFGQLIMIVFFVAVFFAGITSLISILEVSVETLKTRFKISRLIAVLITVAVIFIGDLCIKGQLGAFMDITELYLVPLFSLSAGIFTFWLLPSKYLKEEIAMGRGKTPGNLFIFMGRYVLCALIIILYIANLL
jgi:NSS family neurotransmitter:Na+ symporter